MATHPPRPHPLARYAEKGLDYQILPSLRHFDFCLFEFSGSVGALPGHKAGVLAAPLWRLDCKILSQSRSLRHDNKISRQENLHFQKFIVTTFPMKNSVLDDFPLCPTAHPPLKSANFNFIVVSLSLTICF